MLGDVLEMAGFVLGVWCLAAIAAAILWCALIRATEDRPHPRDRIEPLIPGTLAYRRDSRARLRSIFPSSLKD